MFYKTEIKYEKQILENIVKNINEKTNLELDLEKYRLKERDFLKYTEV